MDSILSHCYLLILSKNDRFTACYNESARRHLWNPTLFRRPGTEFDVATVSEEALHLERNTSYDAVRNEKNTRGNIRAAVDRAISKRTIVILDSLNNIKGYRYELWCIARAAGEDLGRMALPLAQPLVPASPLGCQSWRSPCRHQVLHGTCGHRRRHLPPLEPTAGGLLQLYVSPQLPGHSTKLPAFPARFAHTLQGRGFRGPGGALRAAGPEEPLGLPTIHRSPRKAVRGQGRSLGLLGSLCRVTARARGKSTPLSLQEEVARALQEVADSILGREGAAAGAEEVPADSARLGPKPRLLQPTLATMPTLPARTNLLHDIDRATQEVVDAISEAQSSGNVLVQVPGCGPLRLVRVVSMAELRRHKRTFLKAATQSFLSKMSSAEQAKRSFADFLSTALAGEPV